MKVSVIVPFNKGVHFLRDCFESLSCQTFKDFEVIFSVSGPDKGEEESLLRLVAEYSDKLNIVRIDSKNGVACARNAALDAAKGEYVYFLDADDYLEEDTLKLQLETLENSDIADFTFARWVGSWNQYKVYKEVLKENKEMLESADESDQNEVQDTVRNVEEICKDRHYFLYPKYHKGVEPDSLKGELRREQQYQQGAAYVLLCRSGGIKKISCLSFLIKREFIEKHNIRFDENSYLYADLSFVVQLIDKGAVGVREIKAIYVKHRHNDPVNFPAVNQIKDEKRFDYHANAYLRAKKLISEDGVARFYLDEVILNYYCHYFTKKMRRSQYDYWRKERFQVMHDLVKECLPEVRRRYRGNDRVMIKAAIELDEKAAIGAVSRVLAVKKFINIFKKKHTIPRYLYYNYFTKKPVKEDTILFETFFGKSYSDSPKYIYEYIVKHYPDKYKCVWSVANNKIKVPYGAKRVRRYGIMYFYYLARAKYQVFNVRQPKGYRKNEGTVFLECWHGTPLKRLVFDQEEVCGADPRYKSHFYKHVLDWDYLISPNNFSTEKFHSAFRIDKEKIITCGYPRNDLLYNQNNEKDIKRLKKGIGIPEDKKVILYAPTWRDDDYMEAGKYNFKLRLDLDDMKKRLSDEYVVVLRMHYYIASQMDISDYKGFAFDASSYNDIGELYLISDILITDYSSVFFDYGNLKRPVLFFTYDLEKYRDMLRGFYLDIENDVPGPLLYTSKEVTDAIEHIDKIEEEYSECYDAFYERFCSVDDGHAAERICKKVFGKPTK